MIDGEVDFAFEEILENTYLVAIWVGSNCFTVRDRISTYAHAPLQEEG